MSKPNQQGFTLIEILIYTVIFAIVGGMLTGILINATRVEQRESASAEVTSQLNFVMQTIQRLVRASSNIEIEAGTATSTLKLRMKDSAKDPTYISLSDNAIQLKEGSSATTTLTSDRVVVNTLSFKKFTQYPGHDTVSIDLTLTYNTQNTAGQVQRTLSSAIARVSAATFDSDVLPGGTYNYNLGQTGSPWQKIIMADGSAANPSYTFGSDTGLGIFRAGSNALGFTSGGVERMRISGAAVGIGTTTPASAMVLTVRTPDGSTNGILVNGPGASFAFQDRTSTSSWLWYSSGDVARFRLGDVADLIGITNSGNVGIGTTGPESSLHVAKSGSAGVGPTLLLDNPAPIAVNNAAEIGFILYDNATYNPGGTAAKIKAIVTNGISAASDLAFSTHNGSTITEQMRILANGNVGIGTSTPAAKLQVVGEARTTDSSGNARLWGQGRPGAVRYGTSGVESGLCTNGSVNFGLSFGLADWGSSASQCPSGTWVCSSAERGTSSCDTTRPDSSIDGIYCAGTYVDDPSTQHRGWVTDTFDKSSGAITKENGAQVYEEYCFAGPVWCCSN